jgi:hypothetical protein
MKILKAIFGFVKKILKRPDVQQLIIEIFLKVVREEFGGHLPPQQAVVAYNMTKERLEDKIGFEQAQKHVFDIARLADKHAGGNRATRFAMKMKADYGTA